MAEKLLEDIVRTKAKKEAKAAELDAVRRGAFGLYLLTQTVFTAETGLVLEEQVTYYVSFSASVSEHIYYFVSYDHGDFLVSVCLDRPWSRQISAEMKALLEACIACHEIERTLIHELDTLEFNYSTLCAEFLRLYRTTPRAALIDADIFIIEEDWKESWGVGVRPYTIKEIEDEHN